MNEHVATYYYDMTVNHGVFEVYACYASQKDMDNRNVDFYDVYNKNGVCVNEGDPFYTFPKWQQIFDRYYMPYVN